ncbi:tyrosine-protein phosphatase non-receptor type 7-like [Rhopilema esculentum]|uniref:tyrosine-protein phosphatase non-receptor type 7-like n=1 Tax=Rhopilema esculentum TaxID=499914 RepID=UPI0031D86D96
MKSLNSTNTAKNVEKWGELREVCLYRYMTYNNIPENVNSFVRFFVLEAIKGLKTRESSKLVVHCSDGIGMSAVLVAIANGIESLAKRGSVDVYNIVKVLRNDRAGAVEQFDQYRFIYEALQEYLVQMRDSQQEYINNSDITSSI